MQPELKNNALYALLSFIHRTAWTLYKLGHRMQQPKNNTTCTRCSHELPSLVQIARCCCILANRCHCCSWPSACNLCYVLAVARRRGVYGLSKHTRPDARGREVWRHNVIWFWNASYNVIGASEGDGEDRAPAVASNYRCVSSCLLPTFNQGLTCLNTRCSVDLQSVPCKLCLGGTSIFGGTACTTAVTL